VRVNNAGVGSASTLEEITDRRLDQADAAGRDFSTLSISVFRAPADRAALAEYRAAGVERAVLEVPDQSRDEILRVLDGYVPLLS